MGQYFPAAKDESALNPTQLRRYQTLRITPEDQWPQPLQDRLDEVKLYVGPLNSSDDYGSLQELIKDAVVSWVLAGEDSQNVAWIDLP
jgi:hypothetical protein